MFSGFHDHLRDGRVGREQDGCRHKGQDGRQTTIKFQRQNVRKDSKQTFRFHFFVAQRICQTTQAASSNITFFLINQHKHLST